MSKLITSFHAELNEASYSSSILREWRVANKFERILGGASLRALPKATLFEFSLHGRWPKQEATRRARRPHGRPQVRLTPQSPHFYALQLGTARVVRLAATIQLASITLLFG
jgi:hypothetical protein